MQYQKLNLSSLNLIPFSNDEIKLNLIFASGFFNFFFYKYVY